MSQENVELVRRTLSEFMASGEPVWEAMDDKIECYDHDVPDGGHHVGHEGFVRFVENWSEAWAEWSMDVSGVSLERDDHYNNHPEALEAVGLGD